MGTMCLHEPSAPLHWSDPSSSQGSFPRAGAAGGPKRMLAANAALPSPAFQAIGTVKHLRDSSLQS